jgi:hypothetical protein
MDHSKHITISRFVKKKKLLALSTGQTFQLQHLTISSGTCF